MAKFQYDDTQLKKLFAKMSEKERAKAIRSAFRSTGNSVKKEAIKNIHKIGHIRGHDSLLRKRVRVVVFRKKLGFTVTIASKRSKK